ncbi:hypothetical protein DRE_04274 [Drechslerella stenobrocha 248]|uniref:Uncharacterized protein n=1 Tax=Drechslerella stenobrocha 248 TaxID=1043628 RepID=W7HRA3_9PEZI|nr:hypothetical protein DRE_04274 [Drechslerella stenobrocha 248]
MDHRLPTHNREGSFSPSLGSPESDIFPGRRASISSNTGSGFSLIHHPDSDLGSSSGSPPRRQHVPPTLRKHPGHQRSFSGSFSGSSPPTSPRVPAIKSMRSSSEKTPTKFHSSRGSVDDDSLKPPKLHMIRGKWFYSRIRTILYLLGWATTLCTFILVVYVYVDDYLPYRDTVSTDRAFLRGTWQQLSPEDIAAGVRGMHLRAWPEDIDLTGVYLIIAFCSTGTVVLFGLWLQNIYRSAKSYYLLFTRTEYFTLALLLIWSLGFGATGGYVTKTFKGDKDERDFWAWTCTRGGMGHDIVFKREIYYDGDCDLLTGSWYTLLALCGICLIALLTFPANIVYHSMTKDSGYSRFEQRLSLAADQEERLARRLALRPKEPWKAPKWAKWAAKK